MLSVITMRGLTLFLFALLFTSSLQAENSAASFDPVELFPEKHYPELAAVLASIDAQAPELALRRLDIDSAEAGRDASKGLRLPRLQLEQNFIIQQEYREKDPREQTTIEPFARLNYSQSLYQWGGITAQKENARLRLLVKQGEYREAYRRMLLHIRNLYLNIVYKKEELRVQERYLDVLEKHFATTQRNADEGRVSSIILEQSAITLEEGQLYRERILSDLIFFESEFTRITGWKNKIDAGYLAEIKPLQKQFPANEKTTLGPLEFTAVPQSVAAQIKQYAIEMEENNYITIQSRVRPQVSLFGSVFRDQVESAGIDNIDRVVIIGGLRITWNIFDGYESKHQRLQSKARLRRLKLEAEELEATQKREREKLRREQALILQEIAIWSRKSKLSGSQREAAQLNLESGSATLTQFLESVTANNRDELRVVQLKINLLNNVMQLLSLYGLDPYRAS